MPLQVIDEASEPSHAANPAGAAVLDADVLVLLLILAPLCVAVAVRTLALGEAMGAGDTLCLAVVACAIVGAGSTLRRLRRANHF